MTMYMLHIHYIDILYVPDVHFLSKMNSNVISHKWVADNKAGFIYYYVYINHISYINGYYSYYWLYIAMLLYFILIINNHQHVFHCYACCSLGL